MLEESVIISDHRHERVTMQTPRWSVGDPHPDSPKARPELSFRRGSPTDGAPFGMNQHLLGRYR